MRRLFAEHPDAMAETERFASLIHFSLDELKYNYPNETIGNGETAQQTLERLPGRAPAGVTPTECLTGSRRAYGMNSSSSSRCDTPPIS